MSYVLHKETIEGYWTYKPIETFFRKRIMFPQGLSAGLKGRYEIFSIWREWYDNETREFFSEEKVVKTFDEVLQSGRAIYDWRNRKLITPTDEDARRALNAK